jgi:hypothetical protein
MYKMLVVACMYNEVEVITIPTTRRERERLLRRFPGLLYRVARRHRFDPGNVSRVFHGISTSARIKAAILREIERRVHEESLGAVPEAVNA